MNQVEITAQAFFGLLQKAKKDQVEYGFELDQSQPSEPHLLTLRVKSDCWTDHYPG